MTTRSNQVAEILVKARVIDELQVRSALRELEKWGGRFTRIVADLRLAPDEKVVDALSNHLKLPSIDLSRVPHDAAAMSKIGVDLAETRGVFPCTLKDSGKTLWLAMCEPTDFQLVEEIERSTRCRLRLMVAGEAAMKLAIGRHYRGVVKPDPSANVAAAPSASEAAELAPANTGEFTDAKGEVLGKLPSSRAKPPPPVADAPVPPAAPGVSTLFDFVPEAFTPEEVARIQALCANQDKGSKVLRALIDLCVEKGLLTAADATRLKV